MSKSNESEELLSRLKVARKKIILDQLIKKRACPEQVSLFKQHFGSEVEVTIEGALEVAQIFNWNWAVKNLLNDEQLTHYNNIIQPALETYEAAKQPAWETYLAVRQSARKTYEAEIQSAWEKAVRQSAWETYKAVEQPARKTYKAEIQPALEAYNAVEQPAREAYNQAKAEAFAKAYSLD